MTGIANSAANTRRIITVDDERLAARCAKGHVGVIDDDPQILIALTDLLELEGYACESYTSAKSYLQVLSYSRPWFPGPRCVLCDVKLPEMDGLQFQRKLAEIGQTPMLLMSGESGANEAVSAFRAGAVDFLIKPLEADVLLSAINKALAMSKNRQHHSQRRNDLAQHIESLTEREREVARCVARGLINKDIGHQLGIALRTVKLHRHRAMEKLGVETVVDLARLADEGQL